MSAPTQQSPEQTVSELFEALDRLDIDAIESLPDDAPQGVDELSGGEAEAVGTLGGRVSLGPVAIPLLPARQHAKADSDADDAQLARPRPRVARAARRRPARAEGIRLLAYSHRLERSGAPLYLLTLLRHLQSEGLRCSVVSSEDGPLRAVLESIGIAVHVSHGARRTDAVSYESKLWELIAWAAPQGFDVVHVNAIVCFLRVDLAARLGIPAIWATHESFSPDEWFAANDWSPQSYVRERLLSSFRSASGSAAGHRHDARAVAALRAARSPGDDAVRHRLRASRAYRHGFDRVATRERLGIPNAAAVVLNLATIEPRKAQSSLAMAFAGVAEAHPETQLVLVGETGLDCPARYAAGMREFVGRTGLESRVTIAPVTPDPYQWLGVADVFLLASDIESLQLVVLESMAFELPMVATSAFGVPELVHEGQAGFLCRLSDVGDLTSALERVLARTAEERRGVARAGARAVPRHHDIQRYAARYRALVRALAEDRQAPPAAFLTDQRKRPMVAAGA